MYYMTLLKKEIKQREKTTNCTDCIHDQTNLVTCPCRIVLILIFDVIILAHVFPPTINDRCLLLYVTFTVYASSFLWSCYYVSLFATVSIHTWFKPPKLLSFLWCSSVYNYIKNYLSEYVLIDQF